MPTNLCHQPANVFLKDIEMSDSSFDKLWPDELSAIMPLLAISTEDAITKERFRVLMELLTLAEILELRGKDGFDVVGVCGEDPALPSHIDFYGLAMFVWRPSEEPVPEIGVGVIAGVVDVTVNDIDTKRKIRWDFGGQGAKFADGLILKDVKYEEIYPGSNDEKQGKEERVGEKSIKHCDDC